MAFRSNIYKNSKLLKFLSI